MRKLLTIGLLGALMLGASSFGARADEPLIEWMVLMPSGVVCNTYDQLVNFIDAHDKPLAYQKDEIDAPGCGQWTGEVPVNIVRVEPHTTWSNSYVLVRYDLLVSTRTQLYGIRSSMPHHRM
jgi:hypothetical protein